ncbi:hypothetical protein QZH41_005180 [Actinostola sp. cb2023]|nr:hypothetical protein QZH41_005180 [Actinostola sp. cb2023]
MIFNGGFSCLEIVSRFVERGGKEAEDVVELYRKTSDRMASGGFKLRKWLTNDPEIRESIMTNEDRANESQGSLPDDESYAKSSFATGRKWALVEGTTMANRARGSVVRRINSLPDEPDEGEVEDQRNYKRSSEPWQFHGSEGESRNVEFGIEFEFEDSHEAGYASYKYCIKTFDAIVKKTYKHEDHGKAIRILDIGAGTGLLGALLKGALS